MNSVTGVIVASILLLAPMLLAPGGAFAQQAAVRQACGPEIERHCAGVQPGNGRLRACVKEHFTDFSEPCRQALLNAVTVVKACKADVERTCRGVQPGGGRVQACMKDHFAEYSDPCQQAIITAKFGKR